MHVCTTCKSVSCCQTITSNSFALCLKPNNLYTNAAKDLSEAQNASKKLEQRVKELEAIVADRDVCALCVRVCVCIRVYCRSINPPDLTPPSCMLVLVSTQAEIAKGKQESRKKHEQLMQVVTMCVIRLFKYESFSPHTRICSFSRVTISCDVC